ncbi:MULTISPECIES: hypothetical protein [unclassified Xanthomonas]|uniref:hypothetical protein n=1 Tax=unclassified Xanthomonas TaxID=2643310 RepID=UPI002A81B4D5|nr:MULTISPECIES: hypothetical protein [unclassified Xanthomonas]MDY4296318.1 hypothetical protein [Xanthomonas sp. LF02-5]MDY4358008.1 hypothetical protein [Xanthomonas sp. LF04-12]
MLLVSLVSDSQLSSHQVAARIATQIIRHSGGGDVSVDAESYPTDIIQEAIDFALARNRYPLLLVRRFHAFANIQDGGMSSVLSQLRSLEMEGKLTTIAFSPMTYSAIRKSMQGSQAFLNSVYGDAHEQAVIQPISRAEFVSFATKRGVKNHLAQKYFSLGGGPDKVFDSLVSALVLEKDPLSYSLSQCSETIEAFFERTLCEAGPSKYQLLGALSMGRLTIPEEAFLKVNPMLGFFASESLDGRLICSARVLSRWIISSRLGGFGGYANCIDLLRAGEWRCAVETASEITSTDGRQRAFLALVKMLGASSVDLDSPFFGVNWDELAKSCADAQLAAPHIPDQHRQWVGVVCRWSEIVRKIHGSSRLESDCLTLKASDNETRLLLFFLIKRYVREVARRGCGIEMDDLINIPEVILQALAIGKCGIDFSSAPDLPSDCNFQEYFSGRGEFRPPAPGVKLTLANLIVIVPAILRSRGLLEGFALIDPVRIKSLQGSLVEHVRNKTSHALVELTVADRQLLAEVCLSWIDAWEALEGAGESDWGAGVRCPTVDDLEEMLTTR